MKTIKIEYSVGRKGVDGFIVDGGGSYATNQTVSEFKKYIKKNYGKVIFVRLYKKDIMWWDR